MRHIRKRSLSFLVIPFLLLLSGCDAKPECDSIETRGAVLNIVSNDGGNALVVYAARNSSASEGEVTNSSAEERKSLASDSTKPLYLLDQKIVTTSTSNDKRTLQCSGGISVALGDLKATKEVNFTVQKSSDGKISVSVAPFQF
jgi:hypothetical protein